MAKSIQAEADRLVLLANIGERIVEVVRESGLLRTKRRAARGSKTAAREPNKKAAAKRTTSVSPSVGKDLSAGGSGTTASPRVPQPRTARGSSDSGTKGQAAVEE